MCLTAGMVFIMMRVRVMVILMVCVFIMVIMIIMRLTVRLGGGKFCRLDGRRWRGLHCLWFVRLLCAACHAQRQTRSSKTQKGPPAE